ncbi:MAG TPA: hypothetical protein VEB22_11480, partial [Phycisphaerales bacterium]|nr:hypothetical protein [Phycisphaerales bacterium]
AATTAESLLPKTHAARKMFHKARADIGLAKSAFENAATRHFPNWSDAHRVFRGPPEEHLKFVDEPAPDRE